MVRAAYTHSYWMGFMTKAGFVVCPSFCYFTFFHSFLISYPSIASCSDLILYLSVHVDLCIHEPEAAVSARCISSKISATTAEMQGIFDPSASFPT
ncbi:hypothetical protein VTN00DRAFT_2156 [Thermoascus crustaceus]|uniref:uncharacterized protein n=1 Tax=Thermoascus crustaceus TaxID=5088 RepID=UPI003743F8BB